MGNSRIPYVTVSIADGLRKLTDLREEGVLNGEEFEAAKSGMFPVHPTWFREELRKLTDLREEGVLTEDEFEVATSQITSAPPEMLEIPAGDSHVVYVIPPHMLSSIAATRWDADRRARARRLALARR